MFTGLIEEIGSIAAVGKSEKSLKLIIRANKITQSVKVGDSISTNGVCLTVSKLMSASFEADVMAETIRRSNLGTLSVGDRVNLERAMKNDGRFGGHIVSGHIDGTGKIIAFDKEDNATWITIETSGSILKYIVEKGSVAIDGISLTVAYVDDSVFKVSIIPHTGKETTLLDKVAGNILNIECDIIGKYVEKLMGFKAAEEKKEQKSIDLNFLKENGFM